MSTNEDSTAEHMLPACQKPDDSLGSRSIRRLFARAQHSRERREGTFSIQRKKTILSPEFLTQVYAKHWPIRISCPSFHRNNQLLELVTPSAVLDGLCWLVTINLNSKTI